MDFKNKILLLSLIAGLLSSCNGIMDGIYDDAPLDTDFSEGFNLVDVSGRMTLYLNATKYDEWHYLDLSNRTVVTFPIPTELTGEWDGKSGWTYNLVEGSHFTQLSIIPTDAQEEPEIWDLAIHHFDVRTNGGSVIETDYVSIDQLPANSGQYDTAKWTTDIFSTTHVITDLSDMLAFHIGYQNIKVNTLLSQWATMDFSTPPPVYGSSGKVYIVKLSNGKLAAMQLTSYMSPAGSKGYLTIDIQYPY